MFAGYYLSLLTLLYTNTFFLVCFGATSKSEKCHFNQLACGLMYPSPMTRQEIYLVTFFLNNSSADIIIRHEEYYAKWL